MSQFLRGLLSILYLVMSLIQPELCWACPYHLSLFLRMMSAILYKPSLCSRASEEIHFSKLTLYIHLIFMRSFLCIRKVSATVGAQHSHPYKIVLLTHVLWIGSKYNIIGIKNCFNLFLNMGSSRFTMAIKTYSNTNTIKKGIG